MESESSRKQSTIFVLQLSNQAQKNKGSGLPSCSSISPNSTMLPTMGIAAVYGFKVGANSRMHSFTTAGASQSPIQLSLEGTPEVKNAGQGSTTYLKTHNPPTFDVTLPHLLVLNQHDELEFKIPSCSLQLKLTNPAIMMPADLSPSRSHAIDVQPISVIPPSPWCKLSLPTNQQ